MAANFYLITLIFDVQNVDIMTSDLSSRAKLVAPTVVLFQKPAQLGNDVIMQDSSFNKRSELDGCLIIF